MGNALPAIKIEVVWQCHGVVQLQALRPQHVKKYLRPGNPGHGQQWLGALLQFLQCHLAAIGAAGCARQLA